MKENLKVNLMWLAFLLAGFGILQGLVAAGILNFYYVQIVQQIGINIILAVGLNLIVGFSGQFSLGHAGFWCLLCRDYWKNDAVLWRICDRFDCRYDFGWFGGPIGWSANPSFER